MASRLGWLLPALGLLMGVAYQCLVHSAVVGGQIESIRIALAFVPPLALACWVITRARSRLLWSFVLLVMVVAILVLAQRDYLGLAAEYGAVHAAIYGTLLWFFGRTLRRGEEPLVTRLARRVHGRIAQDLAAYTRRVTLAWCVFFAAQLITSALLLTFAPLASWSLFINILNLPLLALMFTAEYGYRVIRHREFPRASLFDGIRAFSNDAASGAKTQHAHAHTAIDTRLPR